MPTKQSRTKSTTPISSLSHEILKILKVEFLEHNRSSDDLRDGYVGPNMNHLQEQILGSGFVSRVDYDLALKELEEQRLVKTGPMTMYDNPPNSHVVVFAMFSKREYIYLTEAGYKVARDKPKDTERSPSSRQNVHISGGQFYQSPVGVEGKYHSRSISTLVVNLTLSNILRNFWRKLENQ
jgi:hypothetical protein